MHHQSACTTRRAAGRGSALVEVLVAMIVLAVGVTGVVGAIADSTRGTRRARAVARGAELLAAREARWRAAPCSAGAGEQVTDGVRERWSVAVDGGEAVLSDTVRLVDGVPGGTAALVAVAGCAP